MTWPVAANAPGLFLPNLSRHEDYAPLLCAMGVVRSTPNLRYTRYVKYKYEAVLHGVSERILF